MFKLAKASEIVAMLDEFITKHGDLPIEVALENPANEENNSALMVTPLVAYPTGRWVDPADWYTAEDGEHPAPARGQLFCGQRPVLQEAMDALAAVGLSEDEFLQLARVLLDQGGIDVRRQDAIAAILDGE